MELKVLERGSSRGLVVMLIAQWWWRVTEPCVDRRTRSDTFDPARSTAIAAIHG
jgi:hypothetical protein